MRFRQFKMFELLSFHQQHLEQASSMIARRKRATKNWREVFMKPKRRAKTRILRLKISLTVVAQTHTTHTTLTPYTIPKHFSLTSTYMHNRYGYNLR